MPLELIAVIGALFGTLGFIRGLNTSKHTIKK
jgi:hypothetical protein